MNKNFEKQNSGREMSNSGASNRELTSKQGAPSLDDESIIRLFVKGEKKFVFNQNLQIDPQINVVTLKDRKEKILGVIKINCKNKFALVKCKTDYLELIHKVLTENNFVGFGDSKKQPGFFEYQEYDIPAGYKIHYTSPKLLWKTWWPSQRFNTRHNINLNLLMLLNDKWYPIKDIIVHEGEFCIKTLVKEINLSSNERVIWINKLIQENVLSEDAKIPVAERSSSIQNLIVNEHIGNNQQVEKNSSGALSARKDELVRQFRHLEESLQQLSVVHQNEISALQRKHSEQVNKLRQQMFVVRQSIEQLEMRKVE